jgi:hypothetical protein
MSFHRFIYGNLVPRTSLSARERILSARISIVKNNLIKTQPTDMKIFHPNDRFYILLSHNESRHFAELQSNIIMSNENSFMLFVKCKLMISV